MTFADLLLMRQELLLTLLALIILFYGNQPAGKGQGYHYPFFPYSVWC